ncbi:MAG: dephospho-CoA kinase [Christensenellales bacterium]|jgi:dephospho-CoA kinase
MRIIGLTGNIASGKSTVAAELARLGAVVIDADLLAREAVAPHSEGERALKEAFGEQYFDENGLNRRKLGRLVFGDAQAREKLNAILHPAIWEMIVKRLSELQNESPNPTAVIDAALLLETGMNRLCTEVWLVVAPDQVREQRIMERDGLTRAEARARIKAQTDQREKIRCADRVLINDAGRDELIKKARELFLAGERKAHHA